MERAVEIVQESIDPLRHLVHELLAPGPGPGGPRESVEDAAG